MLWSHLVCDPRGCPGHHQILSADGDPEDCVPSRGSVLWQNQSRTSSDLPDLPWPHSESPRVSSPQFPTMQPGGLPPWVHGHQDIPVPRGRSPRPLSPHLRTHFSSLCEAFPDLLDHCLSVHPSTRPLRPSPIHPSVHPVNHGSQASVWQFHVLRRGRTPGSHLYLSPEPLS